MSPRLADLLVERIGGNPAIAVQLVTDWARKGNLVPTTTGFDLREGADTRLPEALQAQLNALLDRLDEDARLAVEILATLGARRIRDEEWSAVCQHAGVPFGDRTRSCVTDLGIARTRRERDVVRWSLEPLLLREVALDRAAEGGRAVAHHEAAAQVLTSSHRASARERAIVHLVDAGRPAAALRSLRSMIDHLDAGSDRRIALVATEEHLLDALGVPPDDPRRVPLKLDRLAHSSATLPLNELRRFAAEVTESGDAALCARVSREVIERLHRALRLPPDDPLFDDAQRWNRVADDRSGQVQIAIVRGWALWRTHALGEADEVLTDALSEAQILADRPLEARAMCALGAIRSHRGFSNGDALLDQAAAAYGEVDDPVGRASVDVIRARIARAQHDLVTALDRARRAAKSLVEALGETTPADLQVGLCRLARGEITQARTELNAVAAADHPGYSVLARGAMLATAVTPPDWQDWDRLMGAWTDHTKDGPIVDPDAAWPLEWAAKRALDAGDRGRGREAYELSAHQYALVHDDEGVARVQKRLRSLKN